MMNPHNNASRVRGEKAPAYPAATSPIDPLVNTQKSLLSTFYSKIQDYVTSELHSERHFCNLRLIGENAKIVSAVNLRQLIQGYIPSLDATCAEVRDTIEIVGGAIAMSQQSSIRRFLDVCKRFDEGLFQIAGIDIDHLSPRHRPKLSHEQRAQISKLYLSLVEDYKNAAADYLRTGHEIQEACAAIKALLDAETSNRAKFIGVGGPNPFYGNEDLTALESNAFIGLSSRLSELYESERNLRLNQIAQAAIGAESREITAALYEGASQLRSLDTNISLIITQAKNAMEMLRYNQKRRNIREGEVADVERDYLVVVSESTFDAVKYWFEAQTKTSAMEFARSLARVRTEEGITGFTSKIQSLQRSCKPPLDVVQDFAHALKVWRDIMNATGSGANPHLAAAANDCSLQIEEAAVTALRSLRHSEVPQRVGAVRKLSEDFAARATAALAASDNIAGKRALEIIDVEGLRKAISTLHQTP